MALILDTGPLLAALDAADRDHLACAALLTDSVEDLVVPALVLGELDYWCARRLPPAAWLIFLDDELAGAYRVEAPTPRGGTDPTRRRGALRRRRWILAVGQGWITTILTFLFSATFYPIETYPDVLRVVVQLTPLYQGVDLIRALTVGELSPILLFHVAYLLVMGFVGLWVVSRRLDKLLLR